MADSVVSMKQNPETTGPSRVAGQSFRPGPSSSNQAAAALLAELSSELSPCLPRQSSVRVQIFRSVQNLPGTMNPNQGAWFLRVTV
jgi:hypothetical protein